MEPIETTLPASVVILTFNEADTLPAALASCRWCDDITVIDSGSTDGTVALAEATGATVHHHPFESFGKQRNWALDHAPPKHPWVFHLDADEEFTPALVAEIQDFLSSEAEATTDGLLVPHKLMLHGRWLRRAGGYPVFQMRFFHRERMRFIDFGHGQREEPDRRVARLHEPYLHHAFAKGLTHWLSKHNVYARREAEEALAREGTRLRELLVSDPVRRRRAIKGLFNRLPARPLLRWTIVMFIQGGWRDGAAGRTYALMLRTYEQMILLHTREIKDGPTPSPESGC